MRVTGLVTDVEVRSGSGANGPWRMVTVSVLERKSIEAVTLPDNAPEPSVGDTVDYAVTAAPRSYKGTLSVDLRASGNWQAFELPAQATRPSPSPVVKAV
jgi:hypothetical protein